MPHFSLLQNEVSTKGDDSKGSNVCLFCTVNGDTCSYQLPDPVFAHMTKFTPRNSPFEVNDKTCMKKDISVRLHQIRATHTEYKAVCDIHMQNTCFFTNEATQV